MSENKKSILAETLEEIQTAKQQVEENASFILTSTLKEQLSDIIKHGLAESEEEKETDDIVADPAADSPEADAPETDDITPEIPDAPAAEEVPGEEGGEEVIDLTGATPEEVLTSFKLMAPTDEIEIVRTDDGISLNFHADGDNADDKIGNSITTPDVSADAEGPVGPETAEPVAPNAEPGAEEVPGEEEKGDEIFEIEVVDDETEEKPVEEAMSHHKGMERRHIAHNENDPNRVDETEAPAEEAPVTETKEKVEEKPEDVKEGKLAAARRKNTELALENAKLKSELSTIKESVDLFKGSEDEYKQAISKLKNQLQEVALFTSNLTFAVKLMTENATTKEEKIQILKRLDAAKSITESREVFKSMNESFTKSKTANASAVLEEKLLAEEKISGASKINETSVYKNPGVERIKEIIGKMK